MPATIAPNALAILEKRYLDDEAKTPDALFRRVSGGSKDYYRIMSELYFLPNSPTLFNMGTKSGGTLSACFVFDIADSLNGDWPPGGLNDTDPNSIIGTLFKASCVAKAGGGVGYYLGNIRHEGAAVKSVHRHACGPVQVLKFLHQLRSLITQGGKRDLAQMGVLPCWHPDAKKFIHCKDEDPQGLSSFNISVSWTEEWLKQVDRINTAAADPASRLWWEQCQSAWRTGCPGMLFFDTINRANATPHLGNINATNPCGETPNLNNEPCNLGSIAAARFLDYRGGRWDIDWDMLKQVVQESTRFLDDILDWNTFPHPDITAAAKATRKLGLGVMGWADVLAIMHIPYDTQEAVDLGATLMKFINHHAEEESAKMALTKGVYPAWESAPEEVKKRFKFARNSTRSSIAPTGTIAIIADVWGSIEPHYALRCERTTNEGLKLTDGIAPWVAQRLRGFVPKTASEVDWQWHIKHQAAFQRHTDLGVSKTINLPNTATVEDVSAAYKMMWEEGCKGGTIFRDGCRNEQVLVAERKPKTSVYTTNRITDVVVTPEARGRPGP
jgi:ribonucleoside-diphosphate reductase alpha chain